MIMRTFKQYLFENEPTPANVDGQFVVGKVKFDNERGIGSTPNNGNVAYMGAVAWMTPTSFRKLAHHADRGKAARELENLMRGGSAIGCPFLDLAIERTDDKIRSIIVKGHEGRARSDAIAKINGSNVLMPVHLFFLGGARARHLDQEIWDHISIHGIRPEDMRTSIDPGIDHVFVAGKSISMRD